MNDFTLNKYKELCETLSRSKYQIITVERYLKGDFGSRFIILRHDVDYNINNAIDIAKIENSFNINSTYYIKTNKKNINKDKIIELKKLGHEIGYHYNVLISTKGVIEKARVLFEKELSYLNSICKIETISAHGSWLRKWNNEDILNDDFMKKYIIIGDAMKSIDFNEIAYYSDTGRNWNILKYNIKDKPSTKDIKSCMILESTNDLINLVKSEKIRKVYISSHPDIWTNKLLRHIYNNLWYGHIRNIGKRFIKYLRK